FGQLASSHTVTSRFSRNLLFRRATALSVGRRTRIQDGLRSTGASANWTGERAILSPPCCLAPGTRLAASPTTASGMVRVGASLMPPLSPKGDGRIEPDPECGGQVAQERRLDRLQPRLTAQVAHRSDLQAGIAAGVDAR